MKKNPVIPYALIAVLGIVLVIVISVVGINQREAIEGDDEGEETEEQSNDDGEEGGGETDDPEAIFQDTCATCHGDDLSGDMGPNLQEVGSRHSEDEIKDIVMNGKGQMPSGLVEEDQADALAEWLADKK